MCDSCDEIIQVGNSGTNGWSPIYANVEETCDGSDVVIQQLISWTGGTGIRPSYEGNVMTDSWLTANPIYLGPDGWVDTICDATNILGADGTNGTNGSNGSTGAAGEDGCDPNITINVIAGSEEIECTVAESGTTCAPVYDITIPDEAFTNDTVVDTITATEAFTTAIDTYLASVLSPTPTTSTLLAGDIGTSTGKKVKYTVVSNSGTLALNTSLSISSFFEYKTIGNTMYLNFRVILDISTSDPVFAFYLEFLIPNSETSSTYSWNPITYNIGNNTGTFAITTNATTSQSYLKVGALQGDTNITNIPGINGTTHLITGQLIFTID